nr:hypothetical protein FVER53263_13269 [Fusarium verticillioides]
MPDGKTLATSDPTLVKLTIDCLGQIQSAFEECVKIGNSSQDGNPEWAASIDSLVTALKRVGWALNGSKTVPELWKKLKIYNDALNRLWKSTDAVVQRHLLLSLDNFNNAEGLRLMEMALTRADISEYQELAAAVRLRRIVLEAKDRETGSLYAGQTSHYLGDLGQLEDYLGLDAAAFRPSISTLSTDLPRTAIVNGQDALLEWKLYKTDTPEDMNQRQYEWVVRSSMRSLAKLLSQTPKPAGLRALNCLGFYEPSARGLGIPVCFAFSPPPLAYREPISLAKLIEMNKEVVDPEGNIMPFELGGVSVDSHMYLGDRFALATTLARAVQQLHNLGWLHKGVRSQSVLFYRPNDVRGVWRPEPRDLYLVGYEFARPASQASLSIPVENKSGVTIYHHPLYVDSQNARYESRFDLYSLGVVLIEIACGKTAIQMAQHGRVDTSAPWEWDLYIAHYLLSEVERKMGKVYGEVVRRCIKGDVGNEGSGQKGNYQTYLRSLDVDIVGKLELCYA